MISAHSILDIFEAISPGKIENIQFSTVYYHIFRISFTLKAPQVQSQPYVQPEGPEKLQAKNRMSRYFLLKKTYFYLEHKSAVQLNQTCSCPDFGISVFS